MLRRAVLLLVVVGAGLVAVSPAFAFGEGATLRDNFNRADETAITGWGLIGNTLGVRGNRVYGTNPSGAANGYLETAYGDDVEAYLTVSVIPLDAGDAIGVGVVASSGNETGYTCDWKRNNTLSLWRPNNGSYTVQLGSNQTVTMDAGDKLGISVIGSQVACWVNEGSGWVRKILVADSTYTHGFAWLRMVDTEAEGDDFYAMSNTGGGTFNDTDDTDEEGLIDGIVGGVFGFMASLLAKILCVLERLAWSIFGVIVMAFNAVVEALGALIEGLFSLLPGFPAVPGVPAEVSTAAAWVAWFFPVGTVIAILGWFVVVWIIWQAVAIGLRWAKAINA